MRFCHENGGNYVLLLGFFFVSFWVPGAAHVEAMFLKWRRSAVGAVPHHHHLLSLITSSLYLFHLCLRLLPLRQSQAILLLL